MVTFMVNSHSISHLSNAANTNYAINLLFVAQKRLDTVDEFVAELLLRRLLLAGELLFRRTREEL